MIIEIKIPTPGESITEVEIANWLVEDGDYVRKDQELAEIESDKATLPLLAEKAGEIKILVETAESIAVGSVACTIDTDAEAPEGEAEVKTESSFGEKMALENKIETPVEAEKEDATIEHGKAKVTPLAKKLLEENNINVDDIIKGLKKITTKEVNQVLEHNKQTQFEMQPQKVMGSREADRKRMSSLRRKLSERLVSVKNETAMLTTFNEIDMSAVMGLRKKYQRQFTEKHGLKLGFMSFFTKAATLALQNYPNINAQIDGDEIVSPKYNDVGIAVQTNKGLMVPVIRNTNGMSVAEIEIAIAEIAQKARAFKLSPEEMTGGTFTITNGGVFGSLLSTPILNPPQSGILGMHNIVERPVAEKGQVVIRPMMYVALSYDHRIVDGRDSVGFLVKVKELIEEPFKLLFDGKDTGKALLGL